MDSNQKPRIDPGWNDPPMLSYTAMNPPPKSRITNKRIAFPISESSSTKTSPSSGLLPSMPSLGAPPISTSGVSHFQSSKQNINEFLKSADAKKHFSDIWDSGKFSDECKRDIEMLAKALIGEDKVTVRSIKEKLKLHYNDLCEQWLDEIN